MAPAHQKRTRGGEGWGVEWVRPGREASTRLPGQEAQAGGNDKASLPCPTPAPPMKGAPSTWKAPRSAERTPGETRAPTSSDEIPTEHPTWNDWAETLDGGVPGEVEHGRSTVTCCRIIARHALPKATPGDPASVAITHVADKLASNA